MPVATLSAERLRSLVTLPLTDVALDDLLFLSKAELEERAGDELHLSATPDRLDLLTESGLALYLDGATEAKTGLPRPSERPGHEPFVVEVDPSVAPLRPYLAAMVVHAPTPDGLDEGTLAEVIRFQELLHATLGRNRRAASLGIYPVERLTPPVRYSREPIDKVRFVPLDGSEEMSGPDFFGSHPMAAAYGALGRSGEECLTLRDAKGSILSLPPILNSRTAGEARPGDRVLLLESTGQSERAVREAVGLLQVVFVARNWSIAPVELAGPGPGRADGWSFFRPRRLDLPAATLRAIAGEGLASAVVERRLAMGRLSAHPHSGGWQVDVPPWRPDLLTAVDLSEDVVLAGGVRPEEGLLLPSSTRGRRTPEGRFRRRVGAMLLAAGFAEPYTGILVTERAVRWAGGTTPIRIRNPVSAEFAYLRDRLLLAHLEVLARNTRYPYPQRFGEVGPVVVRQEAAEAGAETRTHAGALQAGEGCGFADAAALVDLVLRSLDVSSVREPAELTGMVPGRAARVRVAGETVAEVGEVHPELLTEIGVPVPVAWSELDLSTLWTLVHRHETH